MSKRLFYDLTSLGERELYPHLLACKVGMYEKFIKDLEKLSGVKK